MQHIRVCTLAMWRPTFKDQAGELPVPIKPADAVTTRVSTKSLLSADLRQKSNGQNDHWIRSCLAKAWEKKSWHRVVRCLRQRRPKAARKVPVGGLGLWAARVACSEVGARRPPKEVEVVGFVPPKYRSPDYDCHTRTYAMGPNITAACGLRWRTFT